MAFGETLITPPVIALTPLMMLLPYSGRSLTRCRIKSGKTSLLLTSPKKTSVVALSTNTSHLLKLIKFDTNICDTLSSGVCWGVVLELMRGRVARGGAVLLADV